MDSTILFTRPLWVDEWFTVLVASHASPFDVIADLRHGADGGAGLFHLLVWALYRITGGLTASALHVMSLAFTLGALGFTYAALRRRLSRETSVAGVLTVAANSVVVSYAFEARFYALWILCAAFLAWSFGLSSKRRPMVVAFAAILLTTSHWYGVITLALMSAAVFVAHWPDWKAGARRVAPASAGLLAFAVISPLASGQQSALSVVSWVADFKVSQVAALANTFWLAWTPVIAFGAIVVAISRSVRKPESQVTTTIGRTLGEPGMVALLSLTFLPFAMIALSLLGRPSMIVRYALPAALAWAPLGALAMQLSGRWATRAAAIVLAVVLFRALQTEADVRRTFTAGVFDNRVAYDQAQGLGLPIVFASQHAMYPMEAASLGRGSRSAFLELSDSTLGALFGRTTRFYQLNKGIWLERDFARVHAARYGFPRLAPEAALDTTQRFVLLAPDDLMPRGIFDITALGRAVFPHHRATLVRPGLLLLELADARSLPGRSTSQSSSRK